MPNKNNVNNHKVTYKKSGVSIKQADKLIDKIKPLTKRTLDKNVLGDIGGFGALYDISKLKYKNPVLVSGSDGVGTKLKIALDLKNFDGIGIDLVAMCVNDIISQGARPLFFLDYYATGKLNLKNSPFFMLVEGSQIDWGGHANDIDYVVSEFKEFDKTIQSVLDFAKNDGNTLVIVTADHETGGLALTGGNLNQSKVKGKFNTGGHSATMVPVFSYGPNSKLFSGIYENTAIFDKMLEAIQ